MLCGHPLLGPHLLSLRPCTWFCPSRKSPTHTWCPIRGSCAPGGLPDHPWGRSDHLFLCHLLQCIHGGLLSVCLQPSPPPLPDSSAQTTLSSWKEPLFLCTPWRGRLGTGLGVSERELPRASGGSQSNRPPPCCHFLLEPGRSSSSP